MVSIVETGLDHQEIKKMIFDHVKNRLLLCAIDLKIFNLLDAPVEDDRVSAQLNTRPGNTRLLLNTLVACGLVIYKNGKYENTDLVLVSDTLCYEGETLDRIVSSISDALNPGGVMIGIHGVLTKDRTGPDHMALGMLPDALMARGELPDEGFLPPALFRNGFRQVHTKNVFMVYSEMEVDIARK